MFRYAASSTRALSRTLGRRFRPRAGFTTVRWAPARLSACCSRRSMPKISARIGSSTGNEPSRTAVAFILSFRNASFRGLFPVQSPSLDRRLDYDLAITTFPQLVRDLVGIPCDPCENHECGQGVPCAFPPCHLHQRREGRLSKLSQSLGIHARRERHQSP